MAKENSIDKLELAMNQLEKIYGKGTIYEYGEGLHLDDVESISTGSYKVDYITGIGGVPRGRIVEIFGPESCIYSGTKVNVCAKNIDGNGEFHKKWSIKRLYERFHNIYIGGSGKYLREKTKKYVYYISSINTDEKIIRNKICDVVKTGIKKCYSVTSQSGETIIVTKEHKFYVGNGNYRKLGELKIGDKVFLHKNEHYKRDKRKKIDYKYVGVKYHPSERWKKIKKGECEYLYCVLKASLLACESQINNMDVKEYRKILNTKSKEYITKNLKFIDTAVYDIHHKDGNSKNDNIENLEIIKKSEHYKLHANLNHNLLRFSIISEAIKSIEFYGDAETYDIKCYYPNNNMANKFIVHNSGKTTLCLHIIAEAQKMGGKAAFIDAEHALDRKYATAIGVNMPKLLLSQPDYGEQALDVVDKLIESGALDIIVVDSVAALVPKSELEGEMGDAHMAVQARMMSQAMRKLTAKVHKSNTCLIFINQLRSKIGVMFGNPETTTGGNALKFYASMRLDIRRQDAIKDGDRIIANKTKIKVVKSKVSAPFLETFIIIRYGEGIDKIEELIDLAIEYEVIKKSGAWFSYKDRQLAQGRDKLRKVLKEHDGVKNLITKKLFGEV